MNKNILSSENQSFIVKNIDTDISSLLLKKNVFDSVSLQELATQIIAKKSCKKKLKSWYDCPNIYYPNKLNIEQTSSEITAKHKSNLISGNNIIDLTGGFGVDCFYFSKQFKNVTHCEINTELSEIVTHNFKQLQSKNIKTQNINGIEFIASQNNSYDWIYIDPSRRHDSKGKVFLLNDCLPNVPKHLDLLFSKANNILIKVSPLLDISSALKELKQVKHIYIVAVQNEVKELLFILEKEHLNDTSITATNILNNKTDSVTFTYKKHHNTEYSKAKQYLYEPNAAILKSGMFNEIAEKFNLYKLHKHSHLYTSNDLIDFPGRRFIIKDILQYNKKALKKRFKQKQLNITTRNFPKSVSKIREELSIKDGGNQYAFFTTAIDDSKTVLICEKTE